MSNKYREILFRAKCKDTNQLIEGSLITHNSPAGVAYYIFYIDNALTAPFMYRVIPESIQQYTGFKDKYNSKIFEGDELHEITEYDGVRIEGIYPVFFNEESKSFCIDESAKKNRSTSCELCELDFSELTILKQPL